VQAIHLKPGRQKRIRNGHLWAFAGEIAEDLKQFEPGDPVALREAKGHLLGRGYVNPHSLIAVRLMTVGEEEWGEMLFEHRITSALDYRERVCPNWEARRLIYAESDMLPGLIVDQYKRHLIVQSLTAGIERRIDEIVEALVKIMKPESILLKSNAQFSNIEGLQETDRTLLGTTPEEISFIEEGVVYTARPQDGQKTGFYLDQRLNRGMLKEIVTDKRVLDLFSYTGAWGIRALVEGASEAVMVDSSLKAIEWGRVDASKNPTASNALFIHADVGDFLDDAISKGERFDIVILDPPSFIKSRKGVSKGIAAYRALNRKALKVVSRGGYLISCACSYHLDRDSHLTLIGEAARREGRKIRMVRSGGHSPDHPILPGHPETEYLKCWLLNCE